MASEALTAPEPRAGHERRMGTVARGGALNLFGTVVSAGAQFVLTLAVIRGLPREGAGVFFSVTSLFLLATTLGQLGTATGLVYFLSRARALATPQHGSAYMRTALRPVLVAAVITGAVLFVFAEPVGSALSQDYGAEMSAYLRVLAPVIPFAALLNISVSGTRGLGTMRVSALLDQTLRPTMQLLLVVVALELWRSPVPVAVAWVLPYLPLAIAARLAWSHQLRRVTREAPPVDFRPAAVFWRYTAPRALASITQVAMQRLDIVLVGALAGVAQAAVYAAATRFIALGQSAQGALSQSVQPHLGEALATGDSDTASSLYRTTTAWLVVGIWPFFLLLLTFAPVIIGVFGAGYGGGAAVLAVLSASMLVATGAGMVDMVLTMGGRTSWNLANVLVAFSINIGLDVLLIPRIGLLGAAVGWAVAILASNLLPLVQISIVMRLHPFGRATLLAMATSLAAFAVVPVTARLILGTTPLALATGCVAGTAVYLLCLRAFRRPLALDLLLSSLRRSSRRGPG